MEDLRALADELRALGLREGLDVVRFTSADPFPETMEHVLERRALGLHGGMAFTYRRPERSTTPEMSLPGARSLVVAARSYAAGDDERPAPPTAARVARSATRDEYALLRAALGTLGARLRALGFRTRVLVDDNALVDRAAAHRAGIGWWGKNTLILVPGAGSWFVLGSLLTDAPLPLDDGPVEDRCGRCSRCLPACPTGALVAPGVLDARRCLAWLLEAPGSIPVELRPAVGNRIYGCDECQEVCPPNRAAALRRARRGEPAPAPADAAPPVDLVWIVQASDAQLLDRFGHFYLAGRDASLLRRNALVGLGNVADGREDRVEQALLAGLRDPSAVVREHAEWACRRLDRADLLSSAAGAGVSGPPPQPPSAGTVTGAPPAAAAAPASTSASRAARRS